MTTTIAVLPAKDYEEVTVGATAVGLTYTKYHEAEQAEIQVVSNSVRIRWDGGVPTAATGLLYAADAKFTIYGQDGMANFKAIQVAAGATLNVTYLGRMR